MWQERAQIRATQMTHMPSLKPLCLLYQSNQGSLRHRCVFCLSPKKKEKRTPHLVPPHLKVPECGSFRKRNSAQRGSFWPDVPVDIQPKTSVRPSNPGKHAFWHGHAARTSTKKLRSEELWVDFSFLSLGSGWHWVRQNRAMLCFRTVFTTESNSVVFHYCVVNLLRIVIHYSKYSESVTKRSDSLHFQ